MPNRLPNPKQFTAAQQTILVELAEIGATDRDRAAPIRSPGAAARLVDGFFVQKRSHKPKGGYQRTLYWLTERGIRAAIAILEVSVDAAHREVATSLTAAARR